MCVCVSCFSLGWIRPTRAIFHIWPKLLSQYATKYLKAVRPKCIILCWNFQHISMFTLYECEWKCHGHWHWILNLRPSDAVRSFSSYEARSSTSTMFTLSIVFDLVFNAICNVLIISIDIKRCNQFQKRKTFWKLDIEEKGQLITRMEALVAI